MLDAELGASARSRDRPALRRPPPRPLRLGLGERALGPRHRLPRRARRPARSGRGDRPPRRARRRTGGRRDRRLRSPARSRRSRGSSRPTPGPRSPCRRAADRRDRRDGVPLTGTEPDDARPLDLLRDLPDELVAAARGVAEGLARPARARPRSSPARRRARSPPSWRAAAARRRDGRRHDLDRHARAAALLSRAVPHERRARRGAARRAREPRVVRRHRRARAVAAPARRRAPRPRRPAHRPAHADAARAVRRAADDRRRRARPAPRFETALRLQLLGVQRLVGALARRAPCCCRCRPTTARSAATARTARRRPRSRCCSARAQAEPWGANATLVAPRIGWVRGTGLMGANDAIAPLVEERLGVRTFAATRWLAARGLLVTARAGEIDLDRRPVAARRPARRAAAARRRAARPLRPRRPRPPAPRGDRRRTRPP